MPCALSSRHTISGEAVSDRLQRQPSLTFTQTWIMLIVVLFSVPADDRPQQCPGDGRAATWSR